MTTTPAPRSWIHPTHPGGVLVHVGPASSHVTVSNGSGATVWLSNPDALLQFLGHQPPAHGADTWTTADSEGDIFTVQRYTDGTTDFTVTTNGVDFTATVPPAAITTLRTYLAAAATPGTDNGGAA